MNTRKQVLVMSALLMMTLVIVGIYAAWYPSRAENATDEFEHRTAERGSILFARNCRLCHGDVAEGGVLGGRLAAAPALDRPDLRGFISSQAALRASVNASVDTLSVTDGAKLSGGQRIMVDREEMRVLSVQGNAVTVERGRHDTRRASHQAESDILVFDKASFEDKQKLITNTIACGRVGTAMPSWAQTQGGPLSDEQLRQLMVLITTGAWEVVKKEVDIEDRISTRLRAPVSDDTISLRVSDTSVFTAGEAIRIGDERLRVTALPSKPSAAPGRPRPTPDTDKSGIIQVERGVLGTTPLEHSEEAVLYRFPQVSEPSINQAACGQTARPSVPAEPPGLIEPFEGQTVEVVALGIAFNAREITLRTGGRVRVRLDNKDAAVDHNIAFYRSQSNLTLVAAGSTGTIFTGPAVDDTAFEVPAAGRYFFRCDVHPTTMTGTLIVQ